MENRKDSKQIGVAHAYLNALHAGLQGRYTRMNVMRQLVTEFSDDAGVVETAARLNKIIGLYKALWNGEAIDFSTEAPGPDARLVVEIQQEMIEEYERLAESVEALREISIDSMNRDQLSELIGCVAEQAYGREHYIRGLISYGEVFQLPDVADRWRQHLLSCQKEIQEANTYFSLLQQNAAPLLEVSKAVMAASVLLPGMIRCKKVDLQILPWVEKGSPTFEDLQITGAAKVGWEGIGIDPVGAAYWQAYGFSPQNAGSWIESQFFDPGYAASWKSRGFEPEAAVRWSAAGIAAEQAKSYVLSGISDPDALSLAEIIID